MYSSDAHVDNYYRGTGEAVDGSAVPGEVVTSIPTCLPGDPWSATLDARWQYIIEESYRAQFREVYAARHAQEEAHRRERYYRIEGGLVAVLPDAERTARVQSEVDQRVQRGGLVDFAHELEAYALRQPNVTVRRGQTIIAHQFSWLAKLARLGIRL